MDRDVKHGCCSCTHYKLPLKQEPCKGCVRWSNWEDKDKTATNEADKKGAR